MKLRIEREIYTTRTTLGRLYVDEEFYCYTLEDTVRADGIKVMKETAIPSGLNYQVTTRQSPKYGKVPCIHTEDDGVTIFSKGVQFKYCLFHGGNTHIDTEGCVLIARNKINDSTIQGSMKTEFAKLIIETEEKGEENYPRHYQLTAGWIDRSLLI